MPIAFSYPGVYIQEVSSGVRTITGVATSIAAFVGYFSRGPMAEARLVQSPLDFEREFGGVHPDSLASYAVQQFFANGGQQAWVVRTAAAEEPPAPEPAGVTLDQDWSVEATTPGTWGNELEVSIEHADEPLGAFNLTVVLNQGGRPVDAETFRFLSTDPDDPRFAETIVNAESKLVRVTAPPTDPEAPAETTSAARLTNGRNGTVPGSNELVGALRAFDSVELINLISIPDTDRLTDTDAKDVMDAAVAYAEERRAFYIVDPPNQTSKDRDEIRAWLSAIRAKNAAAYFPRVRIRDPFDAASLRAIPNSGTIAGVYARTDTERGVWKAPAGIDASLLGVQDLEVSLNDLQNGTLNVLGLNCLRTFRNAGSVVWGARTREGSDALGSEWKFVPVRRLALFLEESLYRGTQFAVFEPNDEPLWGQIRLNVGTFMQGLFLQGAFQGRSAREAYFVKCDSETTTQADIDRGIVNIIVGFAPLKPAEFVVIRFTQIAAGA